MAAVVLWSLSAQADQRRYALVVGVNDGDFSEETLHFAERDADRVANALTRVGEVPAENLVLVRGAEARDVLRSLAVMGRRMRAQRQPGDTTVLIVYYSGHAGASAAHLRGTQLSFKRLKAAVRETGADAAVLVLDACRSGGATRVKGGVKAEPFRIVARDEMESRGMAIISSSAAGEDAQESDRLRGGIFTHHFVNGILGAADADGNGAVTLSEAYDYTHRETVRTTSATRFVQHPTYAFKMRGRRELVLTRIANSRAFGMLGLERAGAYVVLERDAGGRVVAEVAAGDRSALLVPPGDYLVRHRGRRAVYQTQVRVERGETTSVKTMTRVPYGRTVRKGLATERETAVALVAAGEVGRAPLDGLSVGGYGAVGVRVDLEPLTLETRFRYGRAGASNDTLQLTQDMFGVDFGLYKVFDLPKVPLGLGLGVRLGGDWTRQSFETNGTAPDRGQWVWRFAPVLRFEIAVHSQVSLVLDGGADILIGEFVDPADGMTAWDARVNPFGVFGLTVYLP